MLPGAQPVLVVGTGSIHVRRFVAGLCQAGQQVVLITDADARLVDDALLLDQVTAEPILRNLGMASTVRRCIERWRPRVVHVHQANAAVWHSARAARACATPLVVTLWGSDVLRLHEWNWIYRQAVRAGLRCAAAWTADARALLGAAEEICKPRIAPLREWIPIGIDPPGNRGSVQRERRVLSCRLHKPLYRIDAILRAFAKLPATQHDWVLEVAGAGSETPSLRALAQSLGLGARVEFTGMLVAPELARAYQRSALFASVPESDGTSVSLLESMAAGCLPVLSALPANREWVQDGHNGVLVDDLANLDAALLRAMQWWQSGRWEHDDRQRNEQLVMERALLPKNIAQFIALYERLRPVARGKPCE